MAISAVFGGVILAVMEGVGALVGTFSLLIHYQFGKMNSDAYKPQAPPLPDHIKQQQQEQQRQEAGNDSSNKSRFGFGMRMSNAQ